MRIIKIEWIDSRMSLEPWEHEDCAKELALSRCTSVGFLLYKDKIKTILVTSHGEGSVQGTLAIPTCAIQSIKVVR